MKHPISTLLTILSVGSLVWIAFFAPGMHWTGAVMKPLTVRLIQGESKAPSQGVLVTIMRKSEADWFAGLGDLDRSEVLDSLLRSQMAGRTSGDGLVNLRGQFGAGGHSSVFWKRGSYKADGTLLILKDDGTFVRRELQDLISLESRSLRVNLPFIEVALP